MSDDVERSTLTLAIDHDGIVVRIVADGEVDLATAPQLSAALVDERADGAREVVADLRGVAFIDSTGLRSLLAAHETLGERLRVLPSRACMRIFALAGVTGFLVGPDFEERSADGIAADARCHPHD